MRKSEKIEHFRKKTEFCGHRAKNGQNQKIKKNYKICIKTIMLTNFHIYITFFEEIMNFSIFAHFVLDNRENQRFCSTTPRE